MLRRLIRVIPDKNMNWLKLKRTYFKVDKLINNYYEPKINPEYE